MKTEEGRHGSYTHKYKALGRQGKGNGESMRSMPCVYLWVPHGARFLSGISESLTLSFSLLCVCVCVCFVCICGCPQVWIPIMSCVLVQVPSPRVFEKTTSHWPADPPKNHCAVSPAQEYFFFTCCFKPSFLAACADIDYFKLIKKWSSYIF